MSYTIKVSRTDMVYWYLRTPGGEECWISIHLQNPRHHVKVVVAVDEALEPDIGQIYLFGPGSAMNGVERLFQFMAPNKALGDYIEDWKDGHPRYKIPLSAVTFEMAREEMLDLGFDYLKEASPHLLDEESSEVLVPSIARKIRELVPPSLSRKLVEKGCIRSRHTISVREEIRLILRPIRFISVPMGGMTRQMRALVPNR